MFPMSLRSQFCCAQSTPHRRLRVRDHPSFVLLTVCDATDQTGIQTRESFGGTKSQLLTEASGTRYQLRERRSSRKSASPVVWSSQSEVLLIADSTSVEYRALTPTSEREVFQRVQLGMSLSAAGTPSLDLWVAAKHF